jgi:hypothetical protein
MRQFRTGFDSKTLPLAVHGCNVFLFLFSQKDCLAKEYIEIIPLEVHVPKLLKSGDDTIP